MTAKGYDDSGYLRLDFTDGTYCYIVAGYGGYTGGSLDEYPTNIRIETVIEEELEKDKWEH